MMYRYEYPIDPECPVVAATSDAFANDPMSQYAPMDEVWEGFERKHSRECDRCREFGLANVEVSA